MLSTMIATLAAASSFAARASSDTQGSSAGNQDSSASAFVDCYASVTAETYALAAAKASADAGCFNAYSNVHARTEVQAIVDAHVIDTQGCTIRERDDGNAGSSGTGGADSSSTSVRLELATARLVQLL